MSISRPPTRTSTRSRSTRPDTARTTASSGAQGDWVIAILEGRGIGREVGVVAIESSQCKVVITQYPDTPTYVKSLHLFATRPPSLILVPMSALSPKASFRQEAEEEADNFGAKGEASMLVRSLQDAWKEVPMVGVVRKHWNEQQGYEFITQLITQDEERSSTILSIKPKYFALSAASALFKYLESSHSLIFEPRSLRITYSALQGTCLIDVETTENLELVQNVILRNSQQHLLGLLNRCFTPMATRLLRTNILGPLTDTTVIDLRLDALEEMLGSEERFHAIRKSLELLKKLDVDKLVGQIVTSRPRSINSNTDPAKETELKIARILLLRTLLHALPPLRSALHGSNSTLLRTIHSILLDDRTDVMLTQIAETINEDAINTLQKGALANRNTRIYAIRSQRKLLLDVARETYKEGMDDAFVLCYEMKEKHGISMELVYTGSGFTFTCSKTELEEKDLPRVFINVNKKGKKVEFSSLDLKKRNARIQESAQEIFILSDEILDELLAQIRQGIACLYRIAEAIAMLDMIAAFADVSSKNSYVRPEFSDTLAIKAGRHPLHEHFRLSDGSFVPNDTYASDAATFQIVGGSNMSGKSTLLRQIALLHIMAQIGCYVPALYASFKPVDTLLSRLGNDDSIEGSLSVRTYSQSTELCLTDESSLDQTFSKEMQTMAMILAAMEAEGARCLIIVDELGRGTSPAEGVGIAHAIAERIIKAKATCFFATHFKELSQTLGKYPNVVSLHLETEVDPSQSNYNLTFHHRVIDGVTPLTHYGLELAKLAKLPSHVLSTAWEVSTALESLAEAGRQRARGTQLARRRRELLRIKTTLSQLSDHPHLSLQDLKERIKEIQTETVNMLVDTYEAGDRTGTPMDEDTVVEANSHSASPTTSPAIQSDISYVPRGSMKILSEELVSRPQSREETEEPVKMELEEWEFGELSLRDSYFERADGERKEEGDDPLEFE